MDWLGEIIGTAGSIAGGGIFGLFGSVVGQIGKYFRRKQEMEAKARDRAHEIRLQELRMEAQARKTEQDIAVADTEGSWTGMEASYGQTFQAQSGVVRDLKAMVRPTLTFALWALAVFVFVWISQAGAERYLAESEAAAIVRYMIYTVFFTASSATLWWFGDRALSPPGEKHA